MKQFVILSNIGNRNIKYLKQGYKDDFIPREVFFEKTQFLWENQDEIKNVTPNIIPAILDKYNHAKLILYTTLQTPPYQDTYYEGLILKQILKEKYPNVEIETIVLENIKPNNSDELITWYRSRIKSLKHLYPDSNFIVYNTGGTSQQKEALKTVVEFYFEPFDENSKNTESYFKLYQGNENNEGGTDIEVIKRSTVEELNLLTNIKVLIKHCNYNGALLLGKNLLNKNVEKIVYYCSLRWDGMWAELDKDYKPESFQKSFKEQEEFEIIQESYFDKNQKQVKHLNLDIKYFRFCQTLISKAKNQLNYNNYSGALLTFHQFIEGYISGYIESNSEYKIESERRKPESGLLKYLIENYHEELESLFKQQLKFLSFPVLIFYASKIAEISIHKDAVIMVSNIKETQFAFKNEKYKSCYLDNLRNKIAHEGKGISQKEIVIYKDLISSFYNSFIQNDRDPFIILNKYIEKNI